MSRMDSLNIILERSEKQYTQAEKDELVAVKNSRYVELLQNLTPNDVLPGMRCFFKSCHDRGLKTALASASKNMPQFLHRLVWIFQFWELSIKTVSKWRFPVHLLLWKYGTHSTNAVSTRNEHLLRCW